MMKLRIVLAVVVLSFSVVTPKAFSVVWVAQNTWNAQWEDKYAEWIKQNWDIHFFDKPGKFYSGLLLDCADAVYSARAIFAYENKLPFVIKDFTGGPNKISNEMSRWDSQPEEKRARSFLLYLYGVVGTITLPDDSYLVALNPQNIHSGTFIVTDKGSHHSWTIQDVNEFGLPHLLFASRPAKSTLQQKVGYPSFGFLFKGNYRPQSRAGFRQFRWPEFIGKPEWQVPGYSEDIYKVGAANWPRGVQKQLARNTEGHEVRLQRLLKEACDYSRDRVKAVQEALDYLATIPASSCLDAQKYDDYSTPNRDQRLKDEFADVDMAYSEAKEDRASLSPELTAALQSFSKPGDNSPNAFCPVEVAPGKVLSLSEVRRRSYKNALSDNPHDPLEYRWGFTAGNSARAKKCPKY